jgi:hypothetical protein
MVIYFATYYVSHKFIHLKIQFADCEHNQPEGLLSTTVQRFEADSSKATSITSLDSLGYLLEVIEAHPLEGFS